LLALAAASDARPAAVYDVCRRDTFENLDAWFTELETYATSTDIVKMVVGNKIDEVRWGRAKRRERRVLSWRRR